MQERARDTHWIAGIIAAASTAITAGGTAVATDEWTRKAYVIVGVGGIMVSGAILILDKIDNAWMLRRKAWEEFNKSSVTEQLSHANEQLEKVRKNQHDTLNQMNTIVLENHTLRRDFMDVSQSLRDTQRDLAGAFLSQKEMDTRLKECEDERAVLRKHIDQLSRDVEANRKRLDRVEGNSGEMPAVGG